MPLLQRRVLAAVGVLALVVLGGCATQRDGAVPGADVDTAYSCMGNPVPRDVLENGPTAAELGETSRAALGGLDVPELEDPAQWTVLEESDERVVLLRELDEVDDLGQGDVRTHEVLAIEWVDAPNLDPSPTWMLAQRSGCALTVDLGGLGEASVTLDPAHPLDPAAREVHLLVTEQECNSGEDAEGRVRVVALREGAAAVEIAVGVEPRDGAHTCPSNPPTPFVVGLDEPLGDREVLDVGVEPARVVALP